jgi:hypothetical protein
MPALRSSLDSPAPSRRNAGSFSIKAELQKLLELKLEGEINPLAKLAEDKWPLVAKS